MKHIRILIASEISGLENGYKNGKQHHYRIKCKSLLMSNAGKSVREIAEFAGKSTRSIRNWINDYESEGLPSLSMSPGRGMKAVLDSISEEQIELVKEQIKNNPQNMVQVSAQLSKMLGFQVTKWMLKRFVKKKLNYTWRRIRKSLKSKQDPIEYQEKIIQLCGLLWLEKQGFLKIYYGDESGFNLVPNIPYGWQEKGNTIEVLPVKGKSINAFGLLTRDNELAIYTSEQSINSALTIAFIDDFCSTIKQPCVIVLDNAPIHHSAEFKAKILQWEQQGLYIFYLSRYSPHLNIIETLWRKIKYEWLKPQHYLNWDTLVFQLDHIFCNVGNLFNINFKDQLAEINFA